MHCRILFPFLLKYLMNAEYMISSWPITSKSTLMIPNNFLCTYIHNIHVIILNYMFYIINCYYIYILQYFSSSPFCTNFSIVCSHLQFVLYKNLWTFSNFNALVLLMIFFYCTSLYICNHFFRLFSAFFHLFAFQKHLWFILFLLT